MRCFAVDIIRQAGAAAGNPRRAAALLPLLPPLLLLFAFSGFANGKISAAEIEVRDGDELQSLLGGGEVRGQTLDDGDIIVLAGDERVFFMSSAPEPYYKGLDFMVRTSPQRPSDRLQVVIRYTGAEKAEIFSMTSGKVTLSNIMLEGWSMAPCCPY